MADLSKSLDNIGTRYTVFEKDQVLTETQLNELVAYLDDQARLTRVDLVGVGIVCGLRVSLAGNDVRLSKGVGVTTDGDQISMPTETSYAKFRERPETAPGYDKLKPSGSLIPTWELVRKDDAEAEGVGLDQFQATTGKALADMVGMILVETYEKDQDLCSGTDCDNLGNIAHHDVKLLLVEKSNASTLLESMVTPDAAARKLKDVTADRAMLANTSTVSNVAKAYNTACDAMFKKLKSAFEDLYAVCEPFVADIHASDPTGAWITKLGVVAQISTLGKGAQYAYDFFKDVVETYNAFREHLFDDTTVCCPARDALLPAQDAFPKHLLLGNLIAPAGDSENRTGYYPSPAVVAPSHRLEDARALWRKLDAIIAGFSLPAPGGKIQVTPSFGEDRALEERAIPYYYGPVVKDGKEWAAVREWWSPALQRRGMSDFNYSYHAVSTDVYSPQGGATAPLKVQIGRFPFFRVEGHLGMALKDALEGVKKLIEEQNLPIAVHAILLDPEKLKLVHWEPPRYTDLHRIHQVLRFALADQLDDAVGYADVFKERVDEQLDDYAKKVAKNKRVNVQTYAKSAISKLRSPSGEAQVDSPWRADLGYAQEEAGQFKQGLSAVAKTEFSSPFDTLIGTPLAQTLDRLAEAIGVAEDQADDAHLLDVFLGTRSRGYVAMSTAGGAATGRSDGGAAPWRAASQA